MRWNPIVDGAGRGPTMGDGSRGRGRTALVGLALALGAAGCGGGSGENSVPVSEDADETVASDVDALVPDVAPELDSGPAPVPYSCEGTTDPSADPLVQLGRQEPLCPLPTHFLDIVHDPKTGRIYSVGLPGLVVHQDTGGEPEHLAFFPTIAGQEVETALREYEHVTLLDDGLIATTARVAAQREFEGEYEPIAPGSLCPDGCPPDWECLEASGCSHGCTTTGDCQDPTHHCIYGWCTAAVTGPCEEMGHCALNHVCASGACVPVALACISSEQCNGASQCVDDACTVETIPCQTAGQCSQGRHCIDGLCSWGPQGCAEVTDYATYHRCKDSVCVPGAWECDEDAQCATEEVCIHDRCRARAQYCPGGCDAGIFIIDPTDATGIFLVSTLRVESAAGLAASGEILYVLTYSGALLTVDISEPEAPVIVHEIQDLGSPRKLAVVGERAYIADHSQGLVVVDLSDPWAPSLGATVSTAGGALDVAAADGHLFVACGTAGLQIFSLADPDAPIPVGLTSIGTPMISVAVSDDSAWTTDQGGVQVIDVSDPTSPVVLATEETPSWAMAVDAHGNQAWISDWNAVSLFSLDPTVTAPDVDPSRSEIYLTDGLTAAGFTIANQGAAPLQVETRASDPRLEVNLEKAEIAPGDDAKVTIAFHDDGEPLHGEICLLTNDPDEPAVGVQIASSSEGSSVLVGEEAPDFLLPDLEGELHQLSAQVGHPVVLCYFTTW